MRWPPPALLALCAALSCRGTGRGGGAALAVRLATSSAGARGTLRTAAALEREGAWESAVNAAVQAAVGPVRWRQLLSAAKPSAAGVEAERRPDKAAAAPAEWRGPLWFFAAHHKSGTNLLYNLAKIQAKSMRMSICSGSCGTSLIFGRESCRPSNSSVNERVMFYCNAARGDLEAARRIAHGNLRAVHIIRDPMALVVSSYVYDMKENHDGMHANRKMRHVAAADGVAVEAEFAIKEILPSMLAVYKAGIGRRDVLVVRMEEFLESSASFDAAIARLYNHTVGDFAGQQHMKRLRELATSEDLHRNPEPEHYHVISPANLKSVAKDALEKIPAELSNTLHEYRMALGYAEI